LIPGKKYFFFSHTIKEQEHNRKLLQAILEKKIELIDWETLTDRNGHRVIAFGRWAGIVGGHNAIYTWLNRNKKQVLKRLHECKNLKEATEDYKYMDLDNARILVSGTGRVSSGACEVLDLMGIRNVTVDEYNYEQFDEPVYAQLNNSHMFYAPGQTHFDNVHYHKNTKAYKSKFLRFTKNTDIFINGIYWDQSMPSFFSAEDMRSPEFRIKVIGDITCDIAPEASVPSTIRASTIAEPIYGYHPFDGKECAPYQENSIDVMAVDNLPNELPRDASKNFGDLFIEFIVPSLLGLDTDNMLERATMAQDGKLMPAFHYLQDYVDGK